MKIARFSRTCGSWSYELVGTAENQGADDDYVRISEYVDVEFPPLPVQAVVEAQIGALDKAEADLRSQFQTKLDDLNAARANLRALTVTP